MSGSSGPAAAPGEGIEPRAGERYRIFATGTRGGVIQTDVCAGTSTIEQEAGELRLHAGARQVAAVRSSYRGRGLEHRPHSLRVPRGGVIAVWLERPSYAGAISVTSHAGRLIATATPRERSTRRFSSRLPIRIRRRQTIVLDTRRRLLCRERATDPPHRR